MEVLLLPFVFPEQGGFHDLILLAQPLAMWEPCSIESPKIQSRPGLAGSLRSLRWWFHDASWQNGKSMLLDRGSKLSNAVSLKQQDQWPDWNLPVESSGGCCCGLSWWPQIRSARLRCIHQWDEEPAGCHAELRRCSHNLQASRAQHHRTNSNKRSGKWCAVHSIDLWSISVFHSISISRKYSLRPQTYALQSDLLPLISLILMQCRSRLENKGQEVSAGGNFGKDVKILGKFLRCTSVFHKDGETKLDKPPTAKTAKRHQGSARNFEKKPITFGSCDSAWLSTSSGRAVRPTWKILKVDKVTGGNRRKQEETENGCDLRLLSDWPVLIFRASFDQSCGAESELVTHAGLILFWWYAVYIGIRWLHVFSCFFYFALSSASGQARSSQL